MKTEYKGITIQHGVENSSDRFFVLSEGFNADGYATMNNAKGAITKYLSQYGLASARPAKAATSDDSDKARVKLESLRESRSICTSPSRVLTCPSDPQSLLGGDWWEDENPKDAKELAELEAPASPVSSPSGAYLPRDLVLAPALPLALCWYRAGAAVARPGAETDSLLAALRYEGFLHTDGSPKQPDSRSRNKREGRYAGRWKGLYFRDPRAAQPSAEAVNTVSDSRNSNL